jgi:hypothetical protein
LRAAHLGPHRAGNPRLCNVSVRMSCNRCAAVARHVVILLSRTLSMSTPVEFAGKYQLTIAMLGSRGSDESTSQ